MADDLSAIAVIRDTDSFDLGAFTLPLSRRVSPWKLWHQAFAAVAVCCISYIVYRGPSGIESEVAYHGAIAWWTGWAMILGGAALDLLLIYLLLTSPFMGITLKLDRHWVEARYRGLDLERRHFREPLANYTGVVMDRNVSRVPATESELDTVVYSVELAHPDPDRSLPLYRGDERTAEQRLASAARALGLPAIGGPADRRRGAH